MLGELRADSGRLVEESAVRRSGERGRVSGVAVRAMGAASVRGMCTLVKLAGVEMVKGLLMLVVRGVMVETADVDFVKRASAAVDASVAAGFGQKGLVWQP